MATSVRMDVETERLLDRLARERGLTKSQVIRDAIRLAARKPPRSARRSRPYDAFRGVIGSVRGGPPDPSEGTGKRFRRLLIEREAKRS
ncbi:MAG: ribbon-helix-helix protein, CopG family [Acidobacteriota bacterium]